MDDEGDEALEQAKKIADELQIRESQVEATVKLIDEFVLGKNVRKAHTNIKCVLRTFSF